MLSTANNVVPFFRNTINNRRLTQLREVGLAQDLADLKELSLQLQTTRELFAHTADILNELCTSALQMNITEKTDKFLEKIEALQAGTEALISAMAAHQRRA